MEGGPQAGVQSKQIKALGFRNFEIFDGFHMISWSLAVFTLQHPSDTSHRSHISCLFGIQLHPSSFAPKGPIAPYRSQCPPPKSSGEVHRVCDPFQKNSTHLRGYPPWDRRVCEGCRHPPPVADGPRSEVMFFGSARAKPKDQYEAHRAGRRRHRWHRWHAAGGWACPVSVVEGFGRFWRRLVGIYGFGLGDFWGVSVSNTIGQYGVCRGWFFFQVSSKSIDTKNILNNSRRLSGKRSERFMNWVRFSFWRNMPIISSLLNPIVPSHLVFVLRSSGRREGGRGQGGGQPRCPGPRAGRTGTVATVA